MLRLEGVGQFTVSKWANSQYRNQGLAFAGESNSPFELAVAHHLETWPYRCLRENERSTIATKRSLAVSEEHGIQWFAATDGAALGANRAQFDREQQGIDQLKNALTDAVGIGGRLGLTQGLLGWRKRRDLIARR